MVRFSEDSGNCKPGFEYMPVHTPKKQLSQILIELLVCSCGCVLSLPSENGVCLHTSRLSFEFCVKSLPGYPIKPSTNWMVCVGKV